MKIEMLLDTGDPSQIAQLLIGLGYTPENVVNTLVRRCSLDEATARRQVQNALSQPQQKEV